MPLEKNFPRGGKRKPQKGKDHEKTNLFDSNISYKEKKQKVDKTVDHDTEEENTNDLSITRIKLLKLKMLPQSMNILGTICRIDNHQLTVSLPGCLVGHVTLSNISQPYSNLLKNYIKYGSGDTSVALEDVFSVGTTLICNVRSLAESKMDSRRNNLILSIDPRDVNSSYTPYQLKTGMTIQAAVESLEDHGYVMDVGVRQVRGFLKTKNAESYILKKNNGQQLGIGKVISCIIESCNKNRGAVSVVELNIDPKKVAKAEMKKEMTPTSKVLTPGMQVPFTVSKILQTGLLGKVWHHDAVVHKLHLEQPWQKPNDYERDTEHLGSILYVHPLLKIIYVSLQPHLRYVYPKDLFPGLKIGDIVKAVVKERGNAVMLLEMDKSLRAICTKKNSRDKSLSAEKFKEYFKLKSEHKVRILAFNNLDNVINVSLKKSDLENEYFFATQLKVGQIVKCRVTRFLPVGVEVQVRTKIRGFIPRLHTADFPLTCPQKVWDINKVLKCKVLSVDDKKNAVVLTNKKTLLNSDCPLITSYDRIQKGDEIQGMVMFVSPTKILVSLSENVKGILKDEDLKNAYIDHPESSLYPGKIIQCTVTHCNPVKKILWLSLQSSPFISIIEKQSLPATDVGKIYTSTVTRKTNVGLELVLQPSRIKALLPVVHLSDNFDLCSALLQTYKVGDEIDNVVLISNKRNNIVSKKPCFLAAAREHSLPISWDDNEVEKVVPCDVKKQLPNDCYILSTSNDWAGRSRIKVLSGSIFCPRILPEGFSVMAKIVRRDDEKQKLTFNTSLLKCWDKDPSASVDLLVNYLEEKSRLREFQFKMDSHKNRLRSVSIGSIVNFYVSHETSMGVAGHLVDSLIKAVVTKENMTDVNCKIGETVSGIVVYVDVENDAVELLLNPSMVKTVDKAKNKCITLKEEQKVRAEVIDIKEYYVLAALKGFAIGKFAYIPCRKHLNDFTGRMSLYSIGKIYSCKIKRVLPDGFAVAILKAHENAAADKSVVTDEENTKMNESAVTKGEATIGIICDAIIRKVLPQQLDISLQLDPPKPGRVFCTEIIDDVIDGINPIEAFQVGQKISVRVIERKLKTLSKCFYECSLKPSALKGQFKCLSETEQRRNLYPGCPVVGFVKEFVSHCLILNITPTLSGKVYFLNVSTSPKIVKNAKEYFTVGTGYNATVVSSENNHLELTMTETFEITPGCIVNSEVLSCQYGLGILMRLPFGYRGTVALTDIADEYDSVSRILNDIVRNQIFRCYVISVKSSSKEAALSLRKSRLHTPLQHKIQDPEVENVSPGDDLRGFVELVGKQEKPTKVILGRNLHGFLHLNEEQKKQIEKGNVIQVQVEKVEEDIIELKSLDQIPSPRKPVDKPVTRRARLNSESVLITKDPETSPDNFETTITGEESSQNVVQNTTRKRKTSSSSENIPKKKKKAEKLTKPSRLTASEDSAYSEMQQKNEQKTDELYKKHTKKIASEIEQETEIPTNKKKDRKMKEQIEEPCSSKQQKWNFETPSPKETNLNKNQLSSVAKPKEARNETALRRIRLSTSRNESLENVPRLEVEDVFFSWESTLEQNKKSRDDVNSSSSDDDETEEKTANENKKKKKYDPALTEEEYLYQKERLLADEDRQPQTVDDFDRMVLTSPNSSIIWLKYIAFHLQDAEVDKARAVAERALKTISFREEQEKLNVWTGLLNLENLYGTEETLKAVLQRALQSNDPLRIYNQMIVMYSNTNKIEQAEQIYNVMLKRYKTDKNIWIDCMVFHMRHNRLETARKFLERALKSLPTKQHVDVINRFAQLEFKYGDVERGKTLFDNILINFPRRTEVWSIYVDLLIKQGDIDAARNVLNRALTVDVSVKHTKSLFKKAVEFESKYGTEESVQELKERAREYVQAKS